MNTCPRTRRIPNSRKNNSIFIIASGPSKLRETFTDDNEYASVVWSFLAPPAISQATPIISADRYEKVRKALEPLRVDNDPDIESTHIKTSLHLDQLEDGTLIKTKSKTEVWSYKDIPQPGKACPEYCEPKCQRIERKDIPNAYESFLRESGMKLDYLAAEDFETDD